LSSVNPNLAIAVLYDNPQNVRLQFVRPSTAIQFVSRESESNWTGFGTWTKGEVPDSTNIVRLNNLSGDPQQVSVTHGSAFVHELSIVGETGTMILSMQNGSSFSATGGVTVDRKGVIELDQATLVSSFVHVQPAGQLAGSGRVVGNLIVGATSGDADAVLSPGLAIGQFSVEGNYQQGAGGALHIEVQGTAGGQFDTITVSGEAKLGGMLLVDATGFELQAPGTQLQILSAGSLAPESVFERVDTIGNEDIFFAPIYDTLASGSELAQGSNLAAGMSLGGFLEGDMNLNGQYDAEDVQNFALALTKPETYFDQFFIEGNQSGDIDDNGILDFDDIDNFAGLIPGTSVGAVAAAIERELYGVPEPGSLVLVFASGCLTIASCRRRTVRSRS